MARRELKTAAKQIVESNPTKKPKPGKTLRELSQYVKFTPTKRDEFLESLRDVPNVSRACRMVGITTRVAYNHRRDDPEFAAAWQEALDNGNSQLVDNIEMAMIQKALQGDKHLLMFLAKHLNPQKYGDRYDITSGGQSLAAPPITRIEVVRPTPAIQDRIEVNEETL